MWHYNQYLVKACWRRSVHVCLSWTQWPLGPGYCCLPHGRMDFSLPWFLLSLGLALNRAFCGRCSGFLIMWLAFRILLIFVTFRAFRLLNSLSSSQLYLFMSTPFSIFGPYIVRKPSSQIRAIGSLPFWSKPTSHCRRAGMCGSRSCEWWILSSERGGSTADVCRCLETTHREEQFHVVGIKKNLHVPKNLSDLIHKPNETEWP
jgi:hypothetical protein